MDATHIREEYRRWIEQVKANPDKFETTYKQMQIFCLNEIAAQLAERPKQGSSMWERVFGHKANEESWMVNDLGPGWKGPLKE